VPPVSAVTLDPFAVLGLPRAFVVDLAAIEKTHRELSRALHPDRYTGAAPTERRAALSKAVEVNEAWRVVRDPVRRAEALLSLAGVPVGEDKEPPASPDFLMEVMDQREALADARASKDTKRIEALAAEVQRAAEAAEGNVGAALEKGITANQARSALEALGRLRFYRRFLEEAHGALEALDDAV
jgi:molecular chaperone HscB